MALTENESNLLIEKLRKKYADYGKKGGGRWFDREAFEQRLAMAVKNRMNLEGFILAEISNFEKIREKFEKKRSAGTFSEKADRIIEEHAARIKKYPEISFHPLAGMEITRLYGATHEMIFSYIAVLWFVVKESESRNRLQEMEEQLHFLAMPRGSNPAKRIERHLLLLKRSEKNEIEVERDRNEYLKECGFILHEIIDFCDSLVEARNPDWENPLRLDKMFVEENRKKRITALFQNLTGYGAIFRVREYGAEIIDDFRLHAFQKKS